MPRKALKIEQILPHEWRFCYRVKEAKQMEELMTAVALLEHGEQTKAEEILHSIIESCPGHLDARYYLALLQLKRGRKEEALALWQEAAALGLCAFPRKFVIGEERLEWIWPENRPFLRAYTALGMANYQEGAREEGLATFLNLLSFNPADQQGIRGMALEAAFALGRPEEALRVCEKYSRDILVDTLYARPLALLQEGNIAEATEQLANAVQQYPLVARELLKKRHVRPRGSEPGFVEVGGADEAYEYWRRMGKYWKDTEGALDMLRERTG